MNQHPWQIVPEVQGRGVLNALLELLEMGLVVEGPGGTVPREFVMCGLVKFG